MFREPTVSQETALMRGGKAPMVLISAVHGACCMAGRCTALATPVAGVWLSGFWTAGTGICFFPPSMETHSSALSFGDLVSSLVGAEVVAVWRGVSMPEETLRFSGGFHSTKFFRVYTGEEHRWIWFNSNRYSGLFYDDFQNFTWHMTWALEQNIQYNYWIDAKLQKECHLEHQDPSLCENPWGFCTTA